MNGSSSMTSFYLAGDEKISERIEIVETAETKDFKRIPLDTSK
jgi:hypothetical protein